MRMIQQRLFILFDHQKVMMQNYILSKIMVTVPIQHYTWGYLSFGRMGSAFYMHQEDQWYCIATEDNSCDKQCGIEEEQLNGLEIEVVPVEIEVFQIQKTLC